MIGMVFEEISTPSHNIKYSSWEIRLIFIHITLGTAFIMFVTEKNQKLMDFIMIKDPVKRVDG